MVELSGAIVHHRLRINADEFAFPSPASSERFATMRDTSEVDNVVDETRLSLYGIETNTGSSPRRRRTSFHA